MARKKEPIIERPSHWCINCEHWTSIGEVEHKDYTDISSGTCSHNGYSKVPPMFVCDRWSSGKGIVIDKFE